MLSVNRSAQGRLLEFLSSACNFWEIIPGCILVHNFGFGNGRNDITSTQKQSNMDLLSLVLGNIP